MFGIKKQVRNLLKRIQNYRTEKAFLVDSGNPFNLPKAMLRKSYKLGFTGQEYVLYDLEHNNPDEYCRMYDSYRFRRSIGHYSVILDNKVLFYELVRNWAAVNKIYAYKEDGLFYALEPEAALEKIPSIIKTHKMAFKKNNSQINCSHGDGFKVLEYKDGDYYINRVKSTDGDIIAMLQQEDFYLLEDYFFQSEFENSLFPHCVNTIRIVTAKDKNSKTYSVLHALQRIGANPDKAIDNAGAGGLFSEIDIETGMLYAATSYSPGLGFDERRNKIFYKTHPLTGNKIEGLFIPNWEELKLLACSYHKRLAYSGIPLIAWDFALSDKGATVIEANASCLFRLYQSRSGVKNKPLGLWYKEHGYLSR